MSAYCLFENLQVTDPAGLEAYKQRLVAAYDKSKAAPEQSLPTEREREILRSLGYIQ